MVNSGQVGIDAPHIDLYIAEFSRSCADRIYYICSRDSKRMTGEEKWNAIKKRIWKSAIVVMNPAQEKAYAVNAYPTTFERDSSRPAVFRMTLKPLMTGLFHTSQDSFSPEKSDP